MTWVGGPPGTWVVRHLPLSASSRPRVRPSPRSHRTQPAPSPHPPPRRPSRLRRTRAGDLPSAAWHGQNRPRWWGSRHHKGGVSPRTARDGRVLKQQLLGRRSPEDQASAPKSALRTSLLANSQGLHDRNLGITNLEKVAGGEGLPFPGSGFHLPPFLRELGNIADHPPWAGLLSRRAERTGSDPGPMVAEP